MVSKSLKDCYFQQFEIFPSVAAFSRVINMLSLPYLKYMVLFSLLVSPTFSDFSSPGSQYTVSPNLLTLHITLAFCMLLKSRKHMVEFKPFKSKQLHRRIAKDTVAGVCAKFSDGGGELDTVTFCSMLTPLSKN